jgi:hypothetical protein
MNWLAVIPAWGARCVDAFINSTLPATIIAAKHSGSRVRFMIHTDQRERVQAAMLPWLDNVIFRPVPLEGREPHHKLGFAHREGIAFAEFGECIAFINADMPGSIEIFEAAERRFREGKKLIIMAGTRTLGGVPPVGAKSADLLRWTMANPHPTTNESVFGAGRSMMASTIYFKRGDNVICHAFHLHPFAVFVDRSLSFQGITIDRDLQDNYRQDEIHVITDANEASFAELSPPEKVIRLDSRPMDASTILKWADRRNVSSPLHVWFFQQPIAICGNGTDIGDRAIVADIVRRFNAAP